MSEKQDRQGARTVSDLERRLNLGQRFSEVMGVANDARYVAEEAMKNAIGTNLLTGTKDFSGTDWINLNMWVTAGKYKGFTVLNRYGHWQGVRQAISAEVGEIYTFSAYVKGNNVYFFTNHGTGATDNDTYSFGTISEWKRISVTFTVTQAGIIYPRLDGASTDSNVYICGLKLEKGDKATEWSPAPIDNALTPESVFNALTDNGKVQGVYRADDGQIYINASYINTGELMADLIKAGIMSSKDGTVQVDLTNKKIVSSGTDRYGFPTTLSLQTGLMQVYQDYKNDGNYLLALLIEALGGNAAVFTPNSLYAYGNTGTELGGEGGYTMIKGSTIRLNSPSIMIVGYEGGTTIGTESSPVKISGKTVSWKNNGDGTFTLIGT